MISLLDKSRCCGCGACVALCSQNAITWLKDNEGVKYPYVDTEKCINCNKCNLVCPMMNDSHGVINRTASFQTLFYAAKLKNEKELSCVSSGGAFWGITKVILDNGGVVYGACQNDVDKIEHIRCDNIHDAARLRRSKYLQSDLGETFLSVKNDLLANKLVFFSGTGCQIAGLNMYLNKEYNNLVTAEVICHGVPCGLAWESYRKEKEKKCGKKMTSLTFRDKSKGWKQNQYKIEYEDGSTEYQNSSDQAFHKGYLMGLFYRPSCGNCFFSSIPRVADLSLADYWKYSGALLDSAMGISLVSVNSNIGLLFLRKAEEYLITEPTTQQQAKESCRHLFFPPIVSKDRQVFIKRLQKHGYHKAIKPFFQNNQLIIRLYKILHFFAHE